MAFEKLRSPLSEDASGATLMAAEWALGEGIPFMFRRIISEFGDDSLQPADPGADL
jgi:hypothetical protein